MTKEEFIKYFEALSGNWRHVDNYYGWEDRWGSGYVKETIVCNDGFELSVQNHGFSYSLNGDKTFYTEILSVKEESKYIGYDKYENFEVKTYSPEESVTLQKYYSKEAQAYTYVPIDIILQIIEKHNGIKI